MAELGSDIAGVDDVDATLSVAMGTLALAQAILRRLGTPRGGLIDAPSYGYLLSQLIGSTVPRSVIEQRVLEQVLAEEEVQDARVTASRDNQTGVLTVNIDGRTSKGPFRLTLTQTELTLEAFLDGLPILPLAA